MIRFDRASFVAILVLAIEVGLSVTYSYAGQNVAHSCVGPSLSVSLHERFTPDGELAHATALKFQEQKKRAPQLQIGVEPGRVLYHLPRSPKTSVAVIYESGNRVGSLEFHMEGDLLQIGVMSIYPDYQRLGVGSALFESVVKMNPHVKKIRSVMADDNEKVLHEALAKHLSPEEAIRETPAYKIRAKLGFTRIVPGSVRDISEWGTGRYQFEAERP